MAGRCSNSLSSNPNSPRNSNGLDKPRRPAMLHFILCVSPSAPWYTESSFSMVSVLSLSSTSSREMWSFVSSLLKEIKNKQQNFSVKNCETTSQITIDYSCLMLWCPMLLLSTRFQWETFWDDRGQQTYRVNPLFSELCACSELRKQ